MKPFKSFSDQEVLQKTIELATEERKIGALLLKYLHEVETRRLHLELGYPSLYAYCTKALKLSEGAASRRISSMRLIYGLLSKEESIKVLEKLEQGQLSLGTLSATQYFLQDQKKTNNPYSTTQKQELLGQIQGRSKRECEVLFATLSPQAIPKERERVLATEQTEVRLIMSEELRLKLQKIKALVSHKNPSPTYAELLSIMADFMLKKIDPECAKGRPSKTQVPKTAVIETSILKTPVVAASLPKTSVLKTPSANATTANVHQTTPSPLTPQKSKRSRYIPREIRRQVWIRDQGRCTHMDDPRSGEKCGSQFQVQLNHRKPFAKGGLSTLDNLECLCSHHNLLHAIKDFGLKKMQKFAQDW